MASLTVDEIIVGPALVYTGTAGSTAATLVGYTDGEEGIAVNVTEEKMPITVTDRIAIVGNLRIGVGMEFTCKILQVSLDNLALVLPSAAKVSSVVTVNSSTTAVSQISVRIIGVNESGAVRTWEMLYAEAELTGPIPQTANQKVELSVLFRGIAVSSSVLGTITDGTTTSDVTISTGTFARVAGVNYYKMSGEGAAADVLDDITGSLSDGELFILQIADITQPITVTDLADTIELEPSADWIMTKLNDVLYLQYNTASTEFVETGRINARS